jgi:hypothetical protein
MQKVYKNSISNQTQRTTSFWDALHPPLCSLSLLFTTNKIFPTSAAGAHLFFHSQSVLTNLSTWNSYTSSVHHIWWCSMGQVFTWGWYKLCQTGKDCLVTWLWPSSTLQERPPHPTPPHGLAILDLSGQPSLSLSLSLPFVKEGFSLGKLRKSSKPIIALRQATWDNLGASWGLILDCQCYMGRLRLQCTKAYIFLLLRRSPSFKIWPT